MTTAEHSRKSLRTRQPDRPSTGPDAVLARFRGYGINLPEGAFVGSDPFMLKFIQEPHKLSGQSTPAFEAAYFPRENKDIWADVAGQVIKYRPIQRAPVFRTTTLEEINVGIRTVLSHDPTLQTKLTHLTSGFHFIKHGEAPALYKVLSLFGEDLVYLWVAVPASQ